MRHLRIRVPIDDESSCVFRIWWDAKNPKTAQHRNEPNSRDFLVPELIPGELSFTGISSFPLQDVAVIEDQRGPIMDRSRERLVSADAMIIKVRKRLLRAARDLREGTEASLPYRPGLFWPASPQMGLGRSEPIEQAVGSLREAAGVA